MGESQITTYKELLQLEKEFKKEFSKTASSADKKHETFRYVFKLRDQEFISRDYFMHFLAEYAQLQCLPCSQVQSNIAGESITGRRMGGFPCFFTMLMEPFCSIGMGCG